MALDNVTFTKALASAASQEFQDRIGEVTQENMHKIGDIVSTYPTTKNEFINVLTNQVAKQLFFSKMYENPYKLFNKGMLPYGKSIESIFVDIVQGKDYTHAQDSELASNLLSRQAANVKVEYYSENKRMQYKATISDEELKGAFRTEDGLSSLTSRILQSPLNGAEYDQFLLIKHALAHLKGATSTFTAPEGATAEDKAKALAKQVKAAVIKMGFLSNQYNGQGVMTFSKPQDLVLIAPADVIANMDVELLAQAFNVSYADVNQHVIPIDNFVKETKSGTTGSETYTYTEDTETQAILLDKDAIQIYDTLNSSESFRNPQALYTNVFFNRWGIISACNFANCIKFVNA